MARRMPTVAHRRVAGRLADVPLAELAVDDTIVVLWGDHDQDRRSTFAATEPLAHYQILELELGYRVHSQCDGRGNCGVERASFTFIDDHGAVQTGEIVDLHLACQ